MKYKLLLTIFGLLWGGAACFAQSVLNVHQKDGVVVSYGFSEKPVVTYTDAGVHLSTAKVEVDYPFDNLEKFTFSDGVADAVEQLRAVGTGDDIQVYACVAYCSVPPSRARARQPSPPRTCPGARTLSRTEKQRIKS